MLGAGTIGAGARLLGLAAALSLTVASACGESGGDAQKPTHASGGANAGSANGGMPNGGASALGGRASGAAGGTSGAAGRGGRSGSAGLGGGAGADGGTAGEGGGAQGGSAGSAGSVAGQGGEAGDSGPTMPGRHLGDETGHVCSGDLWCWWAPTPVGNKLTAVWGRSSTDLWAVGEAGTILHFDGKEWIGLTGRSSDRLYGVWGSSADDVWFVGSTTYRYNGLGVLPSGAPPELYAVSGTSASDVWAVGSAGMIAHFDGADWRIYPTGSDYALRTVWAYDENLAYAAGDAGTVFRWNGDSWSPAAPGPSDDCVGVTGTGPDDVWLMTDAYLWHYTGSWGVFDNPPNNSNYGIHATGGDVWLGGTNGVSHWDGAMWLDIDDPAAFSTNAVYSFGPEDTWFVGDYGRIAHYTTHWENPEDSAWDNIEAMNSIWGAAADDIWAVGGGLQNTGLVRHFDGDTWTNTAVGTEELTLVWGSATDDVWAATWDGALTHYDGDSWSTPAEPTGANNPFVLWGRAQDDVFYVVSGCSTLHFTGADWSAPIASPCLGAVGGAPTGDVWGATGSKIYRFTGDAWEEVTSPTTGTLTDVYFRAENDGWAAGSNGILHYNGTAWATVNAPGLLSLERIWAFAPDDVWTASGSLGHVYHFDGGAWTESESGHATPITGMWAASPDDIWLSGGWGTLLRRQSR